MSKILIIVDYQKDFVDGNLAIKGADELIDNIQKLIHDKSYDKLIYTFDTHNSKDYMKSEEGKIFPYHCEFGSEGWWLYNIKPNNKSIKSIYKNDFLFGLKPEDKIIGNEYFFIKDKFSIFEGNERYERFLIENINKNDQIDIVGVSLDVCVFEQAIGLLNRGYTNINIIRNGTIGLCGINPNYDKVLKEIENSKINFI